jgi:hypothetical protein
MKSDCIELLQLCEEVCTFFQNVAYTERTLVTLCLPLRATGYVISESLKISMEF